MNLKLPSVCALVLVALLHACGSTTQEQQQLSYDPSLQPGQVFFNPNAAWVAKWKKVPAPAKAIPENAPTAEDASLALKTKDVPWTIVTAEGKTETLPTGVKPAEMLIPSLEKRKELAEVETTPEVAPALKSTSVAANEGVSVPVTDMADAQPVPEVSTHEVIAYRRPAALRKKLPPIVIETDNPLKNSLAVDSLRFQKYVQLSGYNWEVPITAKEAFATQGALLNAYFFVRRRGESWENLSTMIYGDASRAAELRQWNDSKPLKVGTVLYYESPNRRSDPSMVPIATDFGQKFLKVRTVSREPLTLFAKRIYGEWRTWKEIAYFNGITDPHHISANKRLTIQPRKLGHLRTKRGAATENLRLPASVESHKRHKKSRRR